MPEAGRMLISTNLAQAAGALLLGLLLLAFARGGHRPYLRRWGLSWLAFVAYLVVSAATLFTLKSLPALHPLRLGLTFMSLLGSYLQAAWLAAGTWELRAARRARPRVLRGLVVVAAAVALASTLAFVTPAEASSGRHFVRVGVRSLVLGLVLLGSAWAVRPTGGGPRAGRRIVAAGFALFGAQQLHYFGFALRRLLGHNIPAYAAYLGTVDFLLEWVIGLGMVMALLEEQRAGALHSARQAEHLAYHDPLTGLPNRRLLLDRLDVALAHARRNGHRVALLFVDLDRFKVINDSLGHSTGDELLRQVGTRLRAAVRAEDTLARLGGDEFVLLLPRLDAARGAGEVARKVLETLRDPFVVGGRELFVTASAGVSVAPDDGEDGETLLRHADIAMYGGKQSRGDLYRFFAPEMNQRALERLETESALRRALAGDELTLVYQPVVDLRTGRVCAAEALVRWRHPELGLLGPAEFLEVAEATGLIVPLGAWVLRTACGHARRWREAGHNDVRLLVNLSVRQFQEPALVQQVRETLEREGMPPELLELEITESVAMRDTAASEDVLGGLRSVGVRLSIDDFGTGYSSLEYLRRFPIHTLKVDRTFVRDVEADEGDAAIVSAVVAMAHRLGLTVIAEGVEHHGQLDFLRAQGCDCVQGFLLSRPLCPDTLLAYLAERAHAALPDPALV
ncbi:putative bifunctional diguanylate cyclase/phosphodiesterase [Longimicrobium sp.]|uniref:putative bifunctional diguanylate cyclase/phosphodiesterase n=1 Tax=Longimicrobium sp. TaxID=2029185 RepID=UPI002E303780|nr:EAL domain-containing protein [Longimicrobium sp.]HEX6042198.1 EAL domain-containing protein [Longimicrobium sp.]